MITKELQDLAWSVLPKEFKEEVKKIYSALLANIKKYQGDNQEPVGTTDPILWESTLVIKSTLCRIFGIHNLTSDAEEEENEMLCVSRKKVQEMFTEAQKSAPSCEYDRGFRGAELTILRNLFGSKCLPDNVATSAPNVDSSEPKKNRCEKCGTPNSRICAHMNCQDYKLQSEPKPAEPKFKVGDKVMYKGVLRSINLIDTVTHSYHLSNGRFYPEWVDESDLEPYTEPKENVKMKPIESKVSVYIATKEEDEEFRMLLHENGFKWHGGSSLISDSFWSSDLEDKIHYVRLDKTVTYCGDRTSETLTFSEFKKRYFGEDANLSQDPENCDKQFDNIIKDGFGEHNRLRIAAMAMQGILSNTYMLNKVIATGQETMRGDGIAYRAVAEASFLFADALISQSQKTSSE